MCSGKIFISCDSVLNLNFIYVTYKQNIDIISFFLKAAFIFEITQFNIIPCLIESAKNTSFWMESTRVPCKK